MAARRLDRLLIIDAMSLLFRAFHAVPARFAVFDSQGQREHTNAVYGSQRRCCARSMIGIQLTL